MGITNDREWLTREISKAESRRREYERALDSAGKNRSGGAVGLVIAIIGFAFAYNLWLLWALLGLAGALAFASAVRSQRMAREEITRLDNKIAEHKGRLAATTD